MPDTEVGESFVSHARVHGASTPMDIESAKDGLTRGLRSGDVLVTEATESRLGARAFRTGRPRPRDGKRKNRRTEITLQPNIDELVKIP